MPKEPTKYGLRYGVGTIVKIAILLLFKCLLETCGHQKMRQVQSESNNTESYLDKVLGQ